jgi:membrane protease YdiL (CAAX protease family)
MTHLPLEPRPGRIPENSAPTGADPGSRGAAKVAWIVVILCALAVVVFQQFGLSAKTAAVQAAPAPDAPLVGDFDQAAIMGKMIVKIAQSFDPAQRPQLAIYLKDSDDLPAEQTIALVPAVAEVLGKDAALERLTTIEARPTGKEYQTDIDQLRTLYESGPAALDPSVRTRISKRLGWAGDLALSFGAPDTDAKRAALLRGGQALVVGLLAIGALICFGVLAGLVLLVLFALGVARGAIKPRLVRPVAGGSVGIETVAIFIACFLLLKLVAMLLESVMLDGKTGAALEAAESQLHLATLVLQWLILPVVLLWPMFRQFRQPEARRALGLHSGAGVFKEIGVGIVGYIAGVPIFLAGAMVSLVLMFTWQAIQSMMGAPPMKGPINPLLDYFSQGPLFLILLATLAVIWAPITEELVFRGGMLRQLHTRTNIFVATVITAITFALMHGYPIIMMGSIIGLAMTFAMLRWWRGSLISCMTAHFLHNALVSVILYAMSNALK